MAAFQYAVDLGYQYLETDVHVTADEVLVAFHDEDLRRTCGISAKIQDLSWDQLSKVRVNAQEPIPRLDDLLNTFPQCRINLDCKSNSALRPLAKYLQHNDVLDRVCIGSFSDKRLSYLRTEFGNQLCTSSGPRQVALLRFVSLLPDSQQSRFVGRFTADCIQIPMRQGPIKLIETKLIRAASRFGLPIHVWTVDDPITMNLLVDMEVQGIMTDQPDVLRDVLMERGRWDR